jgi:hypothetical protein
MAAERLDPRTVGRRAIRTLRSWQRILAELCVIGIRRRSAVGTRNRLRSFPMSVVSPRATADRCACRLGCGRDSMV